MASPPVAPITPAALSSVSPPKLLSNGGHRKGGLFQDFLQFRIVQDSIHKVAIHIITLIKRATGNIFGHIFTQKILPTQRHHQDFLKVATGLLLSFSPFDCDLDVWGSPCYIRPFISCLDESNWRWVSGNKLLCLTLVVNMKRTAAIKGRDVGSDTRQSCITLRRICVSTGGRWTVGAHLLMDMNLVSIKSFVT